MTVIHFQIWHYEYKSVFDLNYSLLLYLHFISLRYCAHTLYTLFTIIYQIIVFLFDQINISVWLSIFYTCICILSILDTERTQYTCSIYSHTLCIQSHILYIVTCSVHSHTFCTQSHTLYTVTRSVHSHTLCTQSHVLYTVTRSVHSHTLLPLGEFDLSLLCIFDFINNF